MLDLENLPIRNMLDSIQPEIGQTRASVTKTLSKALHGLNENVMMERHLACEIRDAIEEVRAMPSDNALQRRCFRRDLSKICDLWQHVHQNNNVPTATSLSNPLPQDLFIH